MAFPKHNVKAVYTAFAWWEATEAIWGGLKETGGCTQAGGKHHPPHVGDLSTMDQSPEDEGQLSRKIIPGNTAPSFMPQTLILRTHSGQWFFLLLPRAGSELTAAMTPSLTVQKEIGSLPALGAFLGGRDLMAHSTPLGLSSSPHLVQGSPATPLSLCYATSWLLQAPDRGQSPSAPPAFLVTE